MRHFLVSNLTHDVILNFNDLCQYFLYFRILLNNFFTTYVLKEYIEKAPKMKLKK